MPAPPVVPRLRRGRLVFNLVALVLAALAIHWLSRHELGFGARSAPVFVRGGVGDVVVARDFTVEVPRAAPIESARRLIIPGPGKDKTYTLPTQGLWLSIPVRLATTRDQMPLVARLRDREGRQYLAWEREGTPLGLGKDARGVPRQLMENNLSRAVLAPGFPRAGRVYVEVPRDRLEGLRLQVNARAVTAPLPNDHVVEVDLGLDRAAAARLQREARAQVQTFSPREVTP